MRRSLVFVLSFPLLAIAARTYDRSSSFTVNTANGPVVGHSAVNRSRVVEYLGIPYALPPIGSLRFEAPQRYTGNTTFIASKFVSWSMRNSLCFYKTDTTGSLVSVCADPLARRCRALLVTIVQYMPSETIQPRHLSRCDPTRTTDHSQFRRPTESHPGRRLLDIEHLVKSNTREGETRIDLLPWW